MDDKDFNWMYDTDILDSFVEGEHYSVGRWGMNTHTGYEYCGRSTSKADSTLGEEQLLFLMCVCTMMGDLVTLCSQWVIYVRKWKNLGSLSMT